MASTTPDQKAFRFMDLPRELRDSVYELCLAERVDIKNTSISSTGGMEANNAIRLHVPSGPIRNLLLVSRQFYKEYTDTIQRHAKLVIEDDQSLIPDQISFPSIPSFRHITRAEAHIFVECSSRACTVSGGACDFTHEVKWHCKWLTALTTHIGHMSSCDITIRLFCIDLPVHFHRPDGPKHDELIADLDRMAALPMVSRLQITSSIDGEYGAEEPRTLQPEEIYGTWTREEGWQSRETVVDG